MARTPINTPILPNRITKTGGEPFRSEPAARLALDRRGIDDERYDYPKEGVGIVAVLKDETPAADIPIGVQTKNNGDPFKDEPTARLAIERRKMDPDAFTYDPEGAGVVASPKTQGETNANPPSSDVLPIPDAVPDRKRADAGRDGAPDILSGPDAGGVGNDPTGTDRPATAISVDTAETDQRPAVADAGVSEPDDGQPLANAAPAISPRAGVTNAPAPGGYPRSPDDDPHPSPSDAQKEAGNYRMRHVRWNSLDISIETAKGQERCGCDAEGNRWSVMMPCDYGYLRGTLGADGDHIDVYLGENLDSDTVIVVNQIDEKTGQFDEHKVLAGASNEEAALQTYRAGFSDGKGADRIGSHTVHTVAEFKAWLADGDHKKPTAPIKAKEPAKASLADFSTKDLHEELIKRNGVDAICLGPEDRITKTVFGPAWVIVNRD